MNKLLRLPAIRSGKNLYTWIILFIFTFACNNKTEEPQSDLLKSDSENKTDVIKSVPKKLNDDVPEALKKLVASYPEYLDSADANHLYWNDGETMVWDDGRKKSHDEKLNDPDLEDMMSQKYTAGKNWEQPPAENYEPGRIRYEPFFLKMYGNSSNEVRKNLVNIKWLGNENVSITSVNGVDDTLKVISNELQQLPSEFQKYLKKIGGTFNWRNIAGTNRLSNHSFGAAIDINTSYSDYWQWDKSLTWKNQIPIEIVEIFEKHGFIWGGKWYHYDTMHFEYRPELLN